MQEAAASAAGATSLIVPLSVLDFDVVIFGRPTSFASSANATVEPSNKVHANVTAELTKQVVLRMSLSFDVVQVKRTCDAQQRIVIYPTCASMADK